ncbi:MAG: hypothetical protein ACTSRG_22205 [Candidatus Helarchaeota archaeon]
MKRPIEMCKLIGSTIFLNSFIQRFSRRSSLLLVLEGNSSGLLSGSYASGGLGILLSFPHSTPKARI